jgi:hypothetical protein
VSSWETFSSSSQASRLVPHHLDMPALARLSDTLNDVKEWVRRAGRTGLVDPKVIVIQRMHSNPISRRRHSGRWVRSAHLHLRSSWRLGSFAAYRQPSCRRWLGSVRGYWSSFSRLGSFGTSLLKRDFDCMATTTDRLLPTPGFRSSLGHASDFVLRTRHVGLEECRLSLRERTLFRGAKDDTLLPLKPCRVSCIAAIITSSSTWSCPQIGFVSQKVDRAL